MARKTQKNKKQKKEKESYDIYDQNIEEVELGPYVKSIMVRYGINVSVFRACARIFDGLTPGQRRRLYVFYLRGAFPNKPRFKIHDLLGQVTGYHPHGDQSIEKSFINDIKSWESNVELYDVAGNSGSETGDRAAAVRYLEGRLSNYAMKCFFDEFDPSMIDMVPSNTRRDSEPVVIPSKYPHFLFCLSTGIAWGNAIVVPPFNVNEVCALTISLIKNPNMTNVYLYPDSPRGYDIIESGDIVNICNAGRGSLKIQARLDLNTDEKGHQYFNVYGFPEQTTMNGIMEKISKMVLNKEITGIQSIADKTYLDDVHFFIYLTKDADPESVKDILYRKTALRSHVSINLNFAGDLKMEDVGLKEALSIWIDHRMNMKHRLYIRKLHKKQERISQIDGILVMLDPSNIDKTIDVIKNSDTNDDTIQNLMIAYQDNNITSFQASVVSGLGFNQINRKNRTRYAEEKEKLQDEIAEIQDIVIRPEKIKEIIIEELQECIDLFGRPRQCRIVSPDVLKPPVYKFNVVITQKYAKKLSLNSSSVGVVKSDDEVVAVFPNITENGRIYIVDDMGKVYNLKVNNLKSHDASSLGDDLRSTIGVKGKPISAFKIDDGIAVKDSMTLTMFMNSGFIKKSPLSQYITTRQELTGISLNKDDFVSYVCYSDSSEGCFTLVYTKNGFGLVVDLNNVTMTDRNTKGSQYLKLDENDEVCGVCDVDDINMDLLVITSKGYGKFCSLDEIFKTNKRRANMIRLSGLNESDQIFKIIPWDSEAYKMIKLTLQSGEKIDLDPETVEHTTRLSKGKKLVPVKRGDSILKIRLVPR